MVLSDKDIKEAIKSGVIGIDPYFEKDVQPASVDLHLDETLLIFNNSNAPYIDLKELPDLNTKYKYKEMNHLFCIQENLF